MMKMFGLMREKEFLSADDSSCTGCTGQTTHDEWTSNWRSLRRLHKNEVGRTLPAALLALAVGALLLTSFLTHVSTGSLASQSGSASFDEQYASDAGVEFGIWKLLNDPAFRIQVNSNPGVPIPVTPAITVNSYTPTISVTAQSAGTWTAMRNTPAGVRRGSDLTYPGGDFIYALRGNNSRVFWAYSISGDTWDTSLANTPQSVSTGGKLTDDGGDYVYALRGNNSRNFWRYSISADSWTSMANTLANVSGGAALVYVAPDSIYAFLGANRNFYLYNISGDNWVSVQRPPARVGLGSDLEYTGGDYIYALRGRNRRNFWRYSISGDSWTSMSNVPGRVGNGGSLAYPGGDNLYALRGNNQRDFWRWTGSLDSWSSLNDTPATVGNGGSLVFVSSTRGFALRGRNTRTFWEVTITPPRYDVSSITPTMQTIARIEIDTGSRRIIFWDIQ